MIELRVLTEAFGNGLGSNVASVVGHLLIFHWPPNVNERQFLPNGRSQ